MIDKNVVKEIVGQWLVGKEYFLVDVEVSNDDRIVVEIDHADGVWIDDCVELSKFVEEHLSRDEQDYELEVGSAGLGQPFKVAQQYVNHVGKEVEVLTADGKKVHGMKTFKSLPLALPSMIIAIADGHVATCALPAIINGTDKR